MPSEFDPTKLCVIPGCTLAIRSIQKGWCGTHYSRWRRTGTLDVPKKRERAACSICDKPARGHGLCQSHNRRSRLYGDALAISPRERSQGKVNRDGYMMVPADGHPNALGNGFIAEHRLVMARRLAFGHARCPRWPAA